MTTLTIEDFSCINSAKFELAPVTVMIGPQGSGKSVTSKLLYFCLDTFQRQYSCAERGITLDEFKKETVKQFKVWFPVSAWGEKRFNINFYAGDFTIRFLRRVSKGLPADDLTVTFSEFFHKEYSFLLSEYERAKSESFEDTENLLRRSTQEIWRVREESEERLTAALGKEHIHSQTFIPAGRAFFTSIGRLVAAIEQGSSLDPVTIKFAKLFAAIRDIANRGHIYNRTREQPASRGQVMADLFGGEIKFERDQEFVETKDGRSIPFTALSSGQQELLPMWLLVDFYAVRDFTGEAGELLYIEEPEAHLFPEAQSVLMDFLIGNLVSKKDNRNLILTTHSPYILAKLNNYLLAGQIGSNIKKSPRVSKVISKDLWLIPSRVKAYAFNNGDLKDIMDNDGLIDAEYIDSVSAEVSETFNELLDIQFASEKS